MEAQRQRARAARGEMGYLGDKGQVAYHELDLEVVETPFLGYETLEADGRRGRPSSPGAKRWAGWKRARPSK